MISLIEWFLFKTYKCTSCNKVEKIEKKKQKSHLPKGWVKDVTIIYGIRKKQYFCKECKKVFEI